MIKPAYSVSFLLSINIFVSQNVLYFPNDPRSCERQKDFEQWVCSKEACEVMDLFRICEFVSARL